MLLSRSFFFHGLFFESVILEMGIISFQAAAQIGNPGGEDHSVECLARQKGNTIKCLSAGTMQ